MSKPLLKEGSQGPAVLDLTKILKRRGFLDFTSQSFTRAVRRAVEEFQARHVDSRGRPLVADGVAGPLTWWALEHEVAVEAPASVDFESMPDKGGSNKGRAALEAAIAEMKAGACEVGGNNQGPFVEKYLNGIVGPPANWCAGFVSWCFSQHPDGIPFRYSLGARDIRSQFRDKGWLLEEKETPEPGDIMVWWRGQPSGWQGHIGFVHHVADGIVYTIEGNKGAFPARVRGFDYKLGQVEKLLGFGRVRGS